MRPLIAGLAVRCLAPLVVNSLAGGAVNYHNQAVTLHGTGNVWLNEQFGYVDLDGDGSHDLALYISGGPQNQYQPPPLVCDARITPSNPNIEFFQWMQQGDVVGPHSAPQLQSVGARSWHTIDSAQDQTVTGFYGFADRLPDGTHYGWAKVSASTTINGFNIDFGAPMTADASVLSWAFETTPNTPIAVGEVPEPGVLALLAPAAAVLLNQRRSKH